MSLCLSKPICLLILHRENGEPYACKFLLPNRLASKLYKIYLFICQVISVTDLDNRESLHAATRIRRSAGRAPAEPEELKTVVSLVGGRLSYLNKVRFHPFALSALRETKLSFI